ncbi:MAG TPA: class I SAM-dependent methyltransferase [Methanomassiliicoccales archaeon]|nr:class I SAM-dependent methyltransferase [Methanomassiliicoccales archaeon]
MSEGEQRKQWNSTYSNKPNFFGAEPSDLAVRAVDIFRKNGCRKVLELGCGQGRDTCLFAKEGFQVIALDYSESGICQMRERTREMCLDGNVECMCQDLRAGIPLPDGSVDAVYSHMLLTMELWEKDIQFILDECRRVLRPGGLNLYSVRNDHDPHFGKGPHKGEDMWQNPIGFVVHYFSEDKIKRLSRGYDIVHVREFDDPSPPFTKKLYEVLLRKP